MKRIIKLLALSCFIFGLHSVQAETKIQYELPEGVKYKLKGTEKAKGHLFQIEVLEDHPDYYGLHLAGLILKEITEEEYAQSIEAFKGIDEAEYEQKSLKTAQEKNDSVESFEYDAVKLGLFTGHSTTLGLNMVRGEVQKRFSMKFYWLKLNDSYWYATGMSLRNEEDIAKVSAILESIRLNPRKESIGIGLPITEEPSHTTTHTGL